MPEACHWFTSSPDSYTISRTPCPFVNDSKQYSRHVRRPLPAYLHCKVYILKNNPYAQKAIIKKPYYHD